MTLRVPDPFEARKLEPIPESVDEALRGMLIASCGSVYPGDRTEGVLDAVRFLRANPDYREVVFGE